MAKYTKISQEFGDYLVAAGFVLDDLSETAYSTDYLFRQKIGQDDFYVLIVFYTEESKIEIDIAVNANLKEPIYNDSFYFDQYQKGWLDFKKFLEEE